MGSGGETFILSLDYVAHLIKECQGVIKMDVVFSPGNNKTSISCCEPEIREEEEYSFRSKYLMSECYKHVKNVR